MIVGGIPGSVLVRVAAVVLLLPNVIHHPEAHRRHLIEECELLLGREGPEPVHHPYTSKVCLFESVTLGLIMSQPGNWVSASECLSSRLVAWKSRVRVLLRESRTVVDEVWGGGLDEILRHVMVRAVRVPDAVQVEA